MAFMKTYPWSETLTVGCLLAFSGGFLDTYTYLLRGGVFANAQTGNLVLLGIHLARGEFQQALLSAAPIAAFVIGVLLTRWMLMKTEKSAFLKMAVVAAEAALLFGAGFLPAEFPDEAVTITISFVCALQVSSFRVLHGLPYATTMCTGNLRSAADRLADFVFKGDKGAGRSFLLYMSIIVIFCVGAAAGVYAVSVFGQYALWICSSVYLAVLFLLQKDAKPEKTLTELSK